MKNSTDTHDPRMVSTHLYNTAKWWSGVSSLLDSLGFGVGVFTIMEIVPSEPTPFVIAVLAILGEVTAHVARSRYSAGEWLQRKLDMRDSFGQEIPKREWTDFLARCPHSVKKKSKTDLPVETFFASTQEPGTGKAYENVMESSWWSKHLSETMAKGYFWLIGIMAIISLAAIIIALEIAPITNQSGQPSRDSLSKVANVVTSVLMLVISLRLIDTALGFWQFSSAADRCEVAAESALTTESQDANEASRLWHEYQIARATAPILPTWMWKLRQKELNELWREHRIGSNDANLE